MAKTTLAVYLAFAFLSEPNGMLRHSFGGEVMFLSLQHFIAPALT